MKIIAALILFAVTFHLSAQTDTSFHDDGGYSISHKKDSCPGKLSSGNGGFVEKGNPDFLCDRIYFQNGIKYDHKRSYHFGYVYAMYDTLGRIRHHQYKNNLLSTELIINTSDSGKVFWSHVRSAEGSHYYLTNQGSFREIHTRMDSTAIRQLIKKYGSSSLMKSYLQQKVTFDYCVTFLREGQVESYGVYYFTQTPAGPARGIRLGLWMDYDIFTDSFREKEYYAQ